MKENGREKMDRYNIFFTIGPGLSALSYQKKLGELADKFMLLGNRLIDERNAVDYLVGKGFSNSSVKILNNSEGGSLEE